jgi:hypothetical protein
VLVGAELGAGVDEPCPSRPQRAGAGRGAGVRVALVNERARWAPQVAGVQVICWRCHRRIRPGEDWDLGHPETAARPASRPAGPEHASCNRATNATSQLSGAANPPAPSGFFSGGAASRSGRYAPSLGRVRFGALCGVGGRVRMADDDMAVDVAVTDRVLATEGFAQLGLRRLELCAGESGDRLVVRAVAMQHGRGQISAPELGCGRRVSAKNQSMGSVCPSFRLGLLAGEQVELAADLSAG